MRRELLAALALATVGLAGCLTDAPEDPLDPQLADGTSQGPHAVVALVDTGINPYHVEFRSDDPLRTQHPSTYIPGYPADAQALELTFDAESWTDAVSQDCEEVWSQVEEGQLYWVPGTRIVGAVAHDTGEALDCGDFPDDASSSRVLDLGGHGTMVASRAAAASYGACSNCSIVAAHGFSEASVAWAGANSDWIDVQSNSWGPLLPAWLPTDEGPNLVNSPGFVETVEEAAREHPAFWASGNGVLTRGGLVGHPTQLDPRMTPSTIMVGGHDSGYVNTWPGFPPDIVSDSCNSWAAYHDSLDESDPTVGGGTSGATPYAAGKTAKVLLHAREMLDDPTTGFAADVAASGQAPADAGEPIADGDLTKAELERLVEATAQQRPQAEHEDGPRCDLADGLVLFSSTPVQWQDVPEAYPAYLHIGYGAVNNASTQAAIGVLDGERPLPDRPQADAFFAADGQAREQLHEVWTTEPGASAEPGVDPS